jgi:hypothetical protein
MNGVDRHARLAQYALQDLPDRSGIIHYQDVRFHSTPYKVFIGTKPGFH